MGRFFLLGVHNIFNTVFNTFKNIRMKQDETKNRFKEVNFIVIITL